MQLPQTTLLAKFNALLALVVLIIFIVAFSSNYWLEKSFHFPVNAGGMATLPVDANIGLFTACTVEHYKNNRTSEGCSPDGAADWQIISAGLSVAALVLGIAGTVLAFLSLILQRLAGGLRAKLGIVVCYFLTCAFSLGPLIMFPINRKIQVRPNLSPFQVDFDLAWSYSVSAASNVMFACLVLLNVTDIIWSHTCGDVDKKEDQQTLTTDGYNISAELS